MPEFKLIFTVFLLILAVLGGSFLLRGIGGILNQIRRHFRYTETCEGKVVDIEWESVQNYDSNGNETSVSIIYYPIVEYLGCRIKDGDGYKESPEMGETITIKYNKKAITDMYIQDVTDETLTGPIIYTVIGLLILGFSGLCYFLLK